MPAKTLLAAFVLLALNPSAARAQQSAAQMYAPLSTLMGQWTQPHVTQFQYAPTQPNQADQAQAQYMQSLREEQSRLRNANAMLPAQYRPCRQVPYYNAYGQWVANMRVCE